MSCFVLRGEIKGRREEINKAGRETAAMEDGKKNMEAISQSHS